MSPDDIKIGDKVKTTKGDRFYGTKAVLTVVEIDKKWRHYAAVVCKKPCGKKHIFLAKNLVLVK